ncbi:selenocysteine insertion sequence-binding protein 2 [Anomaloglossus baeobatrachus]|uniref:selenocysteine insertion sequence-binding protein 2 n=1 Tax=Anomaloglossus baeobatrachus TaxID=238106 RepID=UPI003F5048F2
MAAVQPGDVTCMSSERPSPALSWASKVKQPPKHMIPSPTSVKTVFTAAGNTKDPKLHDYNKLPPTSNIATGAETEKMVAKKKKKRKKKNGEAPETVKSTNENIVYQEPPRFQDAEEFPDLISSSAGIKCENKSSYSWGPRRPQPESANQKSGGKKSKKPVQLDLGGMLMALEQRQTAEKSKQAAKPLVLSVGSSIPVKSRVQANVGNSPQSKQSLAPHNPLDSSAPLVKKGKQREVPKAKKPTSLKKIILKEREQRKQLNLIPSQEAAQPVIVPSCGTDSNVEKQSLTDSNVENQSLTEQSPASPDPLDIGNFDEISQEAAQSVIFPLRGTDSIVEKQALSERTSDSPDVHAIVSAVVNNSLEMEDEERPEPADACAFPPDDPSQDVPGATKVSLPVPQPSSNLPKIHSRRFREYCSQVLSKEVDTCVTELLKELVRFQDRLYLKDPVKAKTKRRLVMGLREVLKHLKLKKLKCIIISPNCEKIQSKGGLDDTLQAIINSACEQNIPFVFALNRKALGRCVNKAVPVSVVGIFSYDGAQDHFHKLHDLTMKARQDYKDMINSLQKQQKENESEENDVEAVTEDIQQETMENATEPAIEETDEPNYIKVWKRMLEEKYTPYSMSRDESMTTDLLNFHL